MINDPEKAFIEYGTGPRHPNPPTNMHFNLMPITFTIL